MFKFVHPIVLFFLIAAFVILACYIFFEYRRKKQMEAFGNLNLLFKLMPTRSLLRQRVKFGLVWIALIALIFVTARTQFAKRGKADAKTLNVEMVAVVDVSNSMLCTDVAPSRLENAKAILNSFIDNSDNVKFGLVEFAGTSVTRMPLTSDMGSAKMFVNSMSPTDISAQGTAIGAALRQAQKCFSKNDGVVRCILLLTDAENHEDDAVATAEVVHKDVPALIDVIGIGSPDGANIILADTVLKDENGQDVVTKFDEQSAKDIAKVGEGFYMGTESPTDINETIKKQLREVASSKSVDSSSASLTFTDVFEYFAWIAFFCLLFDAVIMERKNHLKDKIQNFISKIHSKK